MTSLLKNILILLAIVLTGAVGYYLYINNGSSASDDNTASVDNSLAADTAGFLTTLNELKQIQLDGSIFSDPRFISLVSYTQPVAAEPIGRSNPFDVNK